MVNRLGVIGGGVQWENQMSVETLMLRKNKDIGFGGMWVFAQIAVRVALVLAQFIIFPVH